MLKPTSITTENWILIIKSPFSSLELSIRLIFTLPGAVSSQPHPSRELPCPKQEQGGDCFAFEYNLLCLSGSLKEVTVFLDPISWLQQLGAKWMTHFTSASSPRPPKEIVLEGSLEAVRS